jgi:branched-chain amino acid aminotransferase
MIEAQTIQIQKVEASKINQIDFENIPFGRVFTDHMFLVDFSDGAWKNPRIVPLTDFSLHPAASVLHYGQTIFEGMKAFKNESGEVFIFRPEKNFVRFNKSAERMCMPTIDPALMREALAQFVALEKDWIPTKEGSALYIRPFMFATDNYIGVRPSENYTVCIFACPVNSYYTGELKVKIELNYTRAFPGGTGTAKAGGNYAGALYPARLGQQQGYHQLVWTDAKEHKYIEESGTMNIFFKIGNKIFTPMLSDTILDGVTRDSLIRLARHWGYEVEERKVSVEEIGAALEAGTLAEMFGAGTAATVAPVHLVHYNGKDYRLSDPDTWAFSPKAAAYFDRLKRGLEKDEFGWNLKIV